MKNAYDLRYHRFLRDLKAVNQMKPKEHFLYRMMDTVPFKDLETAILMAQIEHAKAKKHNVKES